MSALSNWVTCGMVAQACARRSAVISRTLVMGWRSTAPHWLKSGSGAAVAGAAARAACSFFECALTSSIEILPPGPEPWTCAISTPISRARRRVDGAAGTGPSVGAGAGGASSTTGTAACSCGIGAGAGSSAGAGAGGASSTAGDVSSTAETSAASTSRMGCPTAMVSPCWTRISVTVPSMEEGTSMTALSVSSSITVWSSAR